MKLTSLLCRIGLHRDVLVLKLSPYATWPPPNLTYSSVRQCQNCGREAPLKGRVGDISNWIDPEELKNTRVHRKE